MGKGLAAVYRDTKQDINGIKINLLEKILPFLRWTYGHECADVGTALQQVDGDTGSGKVGWVSDEKIRSTGLGSASCNNPSPMKRGA